MTPLRTCFLGALLLGVSLLQLSAAGFSVAEGRLLDAKGNDFVMRGINHLDAWYKGTTHQALIDIEATGANTVRIVLSNGVRWKKTSSAEIAAMMRQCRELGLVLILEVHDTTGYGDIKESDTLAGAVDFWIENKRLLVGQEAYVIINIGNEPHGNGRPDREWAEMHCAAIRRLRMAGFTHTLMVDAANWGQDWKGITLREAPEVFAADPLHNVVFSVHMYDIYSTRKRISDYFDTFLKNKLPLVVGEFAADHGVGKDVDEASIMELCVRHGLGYIAWDWSGSNKALASLDLVTGFSAKALSPWGEIFLHGKNGIRGNSKKASVFGP